jgi:hypothetical protein
LAEARLSRFFDAAPSAASTKATRNILKGPLVLRLVEYVGCRTERDQFPRVHERSIARYACRLQHVVGDTDDCELEYFDQFLDTGPSIQCGCGLAEQKDLKPYGNSAHESA